MSEEDEIRILPDEDQRPLLDLDEDADDEDDDLDLDLEAAQGQPVDRHWFVYWVLFILGVSTLLPWNFFISASSFWDYKFRNVTNPGKRTNETPCIVF